MIPGCTAYPVTEERAADSISDLPICWMGVRKLLRWLVSKQGMDDYGNVWTSYPIDCHLPPLHILFVRYPGIIWMDIHA